MKEVAKYNENNWFLTHSWYIDDFGLKRNSFEIYAIREDGMKIIYPFLAPIRVHKTDKDWPLEGDDISPYETFEYADMLREQVKKLSTYLRASHIQ